MPFIIVFFLLKDEKRVKVSVVTIEPVDYVQSSKRLLQKIKQYARNQV
jgi:hypothetical protein